MATTSMALSLSSLSLSSTSHPKTGNSLNPFLSISHKATNPRNPPQIALEPTPVWRISAVSSDALPLEEVNPVENSDLVVSAGDDGNSYIISILLFIAFIGLSILTIGVIYIAVTDFLQKREREKFEKDEATKNKTKKRGKKVGVGARAGPRGFGQKIEEVDDD